MIQNAVEDNSTAIIESSYKTYKLWACYTLINDVYNCANLPMYQILIYMYTCTWLR